MDVSSMDGVSIIHQTTDLPIGRRPALPLELPSELETVSTGLFIL